MQGWPAAVLWDMDGTLIDSEPYWFEAEAQLVREFGEGDWPTEKAEQLVGFDLRDSAEVLQQQAGVTLGTNEIVEWLLSAVIERLHQEIPWKPGARELLDAVNDAGIPCVLVTMSWRSFADAVLSQLPNRFVATVTGDEVPLGFGKPHPMPYELGARAVGAAPSECLAIEDSATGAASAAAAGCRVLVVPNAFGTASFDAHPNASVVESLSTIDLDQLRGLRPL